MFKCRTYGRHLAYKNVNMVCVRFKNSKSSASIDLSCQEIQPALKTAFISFLHSITRNYSVPQQNVRRVTPCHVSIYCWTLISPKEHRPSRFWTAGIHPPPTTFFNRQSIILQGAIPFVYLVAVSTLANFGSSNHKFVWRHNQLIHGTHNIVSSLKYQDGTILSFIMYKQF